MDVVKARIRGMLGKHEFYIFLLLVTVCSAIQVRSGQFFSSNNIVDLLHALIIPALFALGELLVIISGGFDLSFPALAALSYSLTTTIMVNMNYRGSVVLPLLMGTVTGLLLGSVNGFVIAKYALPAMIVTLGSQSVFRGLMLGVLDLREITTKLPVGMRAFGELSLFEVVNPVSKLRSIMPATFVILVVAVLFIYFLLNHTLFGRSLYAIGGNESSALRAGIKVKRVKFLLYCLVGAMAGFTGIVHVCMTRQSIPSALFGQDLVAISAVILGGASIYGGVGSVTGALLGTSLLVTVQNSMLLLGIETFWQDFFTGVLIIVGITSSALQVNRLRSRS
jgi:simple sugar transport system permease protein